MKFFYRFLNTPWSIQSDAKPGNYTIFLEYPARLGRLRRNPRCIETLAYERF